MQGLPSSEIEIILLIICRRAGVFVHNTLRTSVLGLTECHSWRPPNLEQGKCRLWTCSGGFLRKWPGRDSNPRPTD